MNCQNCQQSLEENARFCITCGLIFIGDSPRGDKRTVTEIPATVVKSDPLLGRTLDGKYELLARLGQGGMGTVYRARRVHIGDEVAVKVLHQNYSTEDDALTRFRREAQTAATLRHPNVVTIYDYSETRADAMAYLVMEFVPGLPLSQYLKNSNRLPLERAVALMHHICAGVGAAHRRQIVHRDLKPDNIIIVPPSSEGETESVKVVDFGIAKLRDLAATQALTVTGMIIGTPFYMSPEQCRGDELDARSDVYSLGVMFYEMIAGMRPFTAPTPTGVIAKHLTQAPPPLHATLKIPPQVETVLMRALAKESQVRQADALAFARELEMAFHQAWIGRKAISPMPVSGIPQLPLPVRSHTARNAILFLVALFCLIASFIGWTAFRFVQSMPRQIVPQPAVTLASPSAAPTRSVTSAKTSATVAPKAIVPTASSHLPPAKVAAVAFASASPRTVQPPIALAKGQAKLRAEGREIFVNVPTHKTTKVTQPVRRTPTNGTSEEMPPEVRRMLDQVMRGAGTTRRSDGKVTTIYVTRPNN